MALPDVATPAASRPASPELLRSVFRQHATTVAVITAPGERPAGFTANSLTSVSAEPPVVSFGIATVGSSWPAVSRATHVGVHLLAEDQQEVGARFARSGADRFGPATAWRPGPEGVPLLDGVLAWMVCRIIARVPAGDHRIVLAEAVTGDTVPDTRPLLYHRGAFTALRD
ncbi:flavin reductase family protein [Streptomyces sp. NPDC058045]|uniref:flavin reductase family protein n=1 Tax=Streptomyces sp. NPDC058045 TaxID=3346311 RepID=UPI0036F0A9C7